MKKGILSALVVAAAFTLVAAPSAMNPNTAHAADGVWSSYGVWQGYAVNGYSNYRAVGTDGGDFKFTLLSKNTSGTIYVRLTNAYGTVIGAEAPVSVGSSKVWSGMKAGTDVVVQVRTTGSAGTFSAELFD